MIHNQMNTTITILKKNINQQNNQNHQREDRNVPICKFFLKGVVNMQLLSSKKCKKLMGHGNLGKSCKYSSFQRIVIGYYLCVKKLFRDDLANKFYFLVVIIQKLEKFVWRILHPSCKEIIDKPFVKQWLSWRLWHLFPF